MNRLLLLLLALLVACAPAKAPVPTTVIEVAGVLGGETIWEGEVRMIGDVNVPAGSRLVIRPGTTVRIATSLSTKIDPEYLSPGTEILIRGSLAVQGTREAPVRFLPAALPEGEEGQETLWGGLLLEGAEEVAIVHAQIEKAETGILSIASSPEIRANLLADCRYGIIAQQVSAPRILDNVISGGEGGIFCWRGSTPVLQGNRLSGQEEEGIYIDRTSAPRLGANSVTGAAIGVALYDRNLPLDALDLEGNGEAVRYLGTQGVGRE